MLTMPITPMNVEMTTRSCAVRKNRPSTPRTPSTQSVMVSARSSASNGGGGHRIHEGGNHDTPGEELDIFTHIHEDLDASIHR